MRGNGLSRCGSRDFLACRLSYGLEVKRGKRQLIEQNTGSGIVFSYGRLRQKSEGKVEIAGFIGLQVSGVEPMIESGVVAHLSQFAKLALQRAVEIVNGNQMVGIGAAHRKLIVRQGGNLSGCGYAEMCEESPACSVDAYTVAGRIGDVDPS